MCFEQNAAQFRALNQIMWQVPVLAMTVTGGLWFGAATLREMSGFQTILLALAGVANLGFVVVLIRLRYVMQKYLEAMKGYHATSFVETKGGWVAGTFCLLLLLSAIASAVAVSIVRHGGTKHHEHRIEFVESDE